MQNKKNNLEFEMPLLELEKQLEEMKSSQDSELDFTEEIDAIEKKIEKTKKEVYSDLTPWQRFNFLVIPQDPIRWTTLNAFS